MRSSIFLFWGTLGAGWWYNFAAAIWLKLQVSVLLRSLAVPGAPRRLSLERVLDAWPEYLRSLSRDTRSRREVPYSPEVWRMVC
eukprot:3273441-Amphidinium_carterae.1